MIFPTSENKMIEKMFNSFNYQLKFLQRNKFLSFFFLLQKLLQFHRYTIFYYISFVDARCFNFQKNTQCAVGSISRFQRVVIQSGSIFNWITKLHTKNKLNETSCWVAPFLANINRQQKKNLRIKLLRPNIFALFVLCIFSKFIWY